MRSLLTSALIMAVIAFGSVSSAQSGVGRDAIRRPPEGPSSPTRGAAAAPRTPVVNVTPTDSLHFSLGWRHEPGDAVTATRVEIDGVVQYNGAPRENWTAAAPFNSAHTARVCATNAFGEACSAPVTAYPQLVSPDQPANVSVTIVRRSGGGDLGGQARIARMATVSWNYLPGLVRVPPFFYAIEREDRVAGPNAQRVRAWRELERTGRGEREHVFELTVTIGVREGTRYRVCAIVPPLGASGTVCSEPTSP